MTRGSHEGRAARLAWLLPLYANVILLQMVTFVLRPTAIYRGIELGVTAGWLGFLGASFAILPLLLAVPIGHLTDRYGEHRVLLVGVGATLGATSVFVSGAGSLIGLTVATMLLGVGHMACAVSQQAMVGSRTPRARYDEAYGQYTFVVSLGQALGPGLILLFGGSQAIPDTQGIFQWSLAMSLLLGLSIVLLPRRSRPRGPVTGQPLGFLSILRLPGLVHAITVSCVVIAAIDLTLVYLPLLGSERGLSSGFVGILLSLRAASSMISRLFLGALTGRFGRGLVLRSSVLLSALVMLALAFPVPPLVLIGIVVLLGFGLGAGQPLTMSWLAESAPPGLLGRAVSLRLMGNRFGQVLLPAAAGGIAGIAGAAGVFAMTAAALLGAGFVSRHLPGPEGRG